MSSERVTRNCYPSRLAPPPLSEFSGLQGKVSLNLNLNFVSFPLFGTKNYEFIYFWKNKLRFTEFI